MMKKLVVGAVAVTVLLLGCEWFRPPPVAFPEWIEGVWSGSNESSWHMWNFSNEEGVEHSQIIFSWGPDSGTESEFTERGWTVEVDATTYTITSESEILVKSLNPPYNTYETEMWHTFTIVPDGPGGLPYLIYDYLGSYDEVELFPSDV